MQFLKLIKPIQYFTLVYAVLYVLFIFEGDPEGGFNFSTAEDIGVHLLFVLFIIGFGFSWRNGIVTGVIFILWNVGMWILELFFVEKDGGFGILSGLPLIVLGVFYIADGIEAKRKQLLLKEEKWRLILQLLFSIYTVLHFVPIAAEFTKGSEHEIFSWPGIMLLVLFLMYSTAYVLSWSHHAIAGILCVVWYIALVLTSNTYFEFGDSGPWTGFGVVVLVQGILYLIYSSRIRTANLEK